jgi:hypothetical protein
MIVGEGGGFSGRWNGYAIQDGDSVYAWRGSGPGENMRFIGRLSTDSIRILWNEVASTHLLDSSSVAVNANYSRILTIRASGNERSFICSVDKNVDGVCDLASRIEARAVSMIIQSFHL